MLKSMVRSPTLPKRYSVLRLIVRSLTLQKRCSVLKVDNSVSYPAEEVFNAKVDGSISTR